MSEYVEKLDYLEETKALIREAIVEKGVDVSESDSFRSYAEKIEEITTGGGSGEIPRGTPLTRDDFPLSNAVKERRIKAPFTFYDYDGTVLGQYTKAEIDAMTSEDDFPTPIGSSEYPLTFVGWNWTLDELKAEPYGINVGAIYAHILDDGTQSPLSIFMNVTEEVTLQFYNTYSNYIAIKNRSTGEFVVPYTNSNSSLSGTVLTAGKYVILLSSNADGTTGEYDFISLTGAFLQKGYEYVEGVCFGDHYNGHTGIIIDAPTEVKFVCYNARVGQYNNGSADLKNFICNHFSDRRLNTEALYPCNCKTISFCSGYPITITNGSQLEELLIPFSFKNILSIQTTSSLKELYVPAGCQVTNSNSTSPLGFFNGLEEIYFEEGSGWGTCALAKSSITSLYLPELSSVDLNGSAGIQELYTMPTGIKKLRLPENLKILRWSSIFTGASTHKGMPELESIYLPDSLTTLGHSCFIRCKSLKNIYVPDSVTEIKEACFASSNLSLDKIRLPEGVQISPTLVFADTPMQELRKNITFTGTTNYSPYGSCKYLIGEVTVQEGVTALSGTTSSSSASNGFFDNGSFQACCNLSKVNLPSTLTTIGNRSFEGCSALKEITIPDNVTSIGDYAFYYCKSLGRIALPKKLTSISGNCFNGCESLRDIYIPEGITKIGSSSFSSCYALTSITIPSTVTDMNSSGIFINCSNLIEYHMKPTTPPTLNNRVFGYGSTLPAGANAKIYVPYSGDHSILTAYQTATNWSQWAKYIVEEEQTS